MTDQKTLDEALRRAAEAVDRIRDVPQASTHKQLHAALASLAHDGWVLVPREATPETEAGA